jgi:hypothetical protein
MGQQGPHCPGVLVSHRDRSHILVAATNEPSKPTRILLWALGLLYDSAAAMDKQSPQVGLAPLADAQ